MEKKDHDSLVEIFEIAVAIGERKLAGESLEALEQIVPRTSRSKDARKEEIDRFSKKFEAMEGGESGTREEGAPATVGPVADEAEEVEGSRQ